MKNQSRLAIISQTSIFYCTNNRKCGYALISPLRSLTLTSVEMMGGG